MSDLGWGNVGWGNGTRKPGDVESAALAGFALRPLRSCESFPAFPSHISNISNPTYPTSHISHMLVASHIPDPTSHIGGRFRVPARTNATDRAQPIAKQRLTRVRPAGGSPKLSKTLKNSPKLSQFSPKLSKTLEISRRLILGSGRFEAGRMLAAANRYQVHTPQALTAKNPAEKSRKKSQKINESQPKSKKVIPKSTQPGRKSGERGGTGTDSGDSGRGDGEWDRGSSGGRLMACAGT
jgi:hypothetical protein